MSAPHRTSGALTTNGIVAAGTGMLSNIIAGAGAVSVYDGLSTSGTPLIATVPSSSVRSFDPPVKYATGLYITVASGTASLAANNFSTST